MKGDLKISAAYLFGALLGYALGLRRGEQIGEMFAAMRSIPDALYPHGDCIYKEEAALLRDESAETASIQRVLLIVTGIAGIIVGMLLMSIIVAIPG